MKGVIIAGGEGTRLRPLTYAIPKPVIPIVGKPLILHQIELFKRSGINEIIIAVNYLADEIKEILGDGSKFGVNISYSIEKTALGTAGAVKLAQEYFNGDDLIIVFNGDTITDINLQDVISFHKAKKAKVTLTLTAVEDPTDFGLIVTDENNRVKQFLEKPSWDEVTTNNINAGIYVIDVDIFHLVPANQQYSFERDLYPKLLFEDVPIYGYLSHAYWQDVGSPEKYLLVHHDILSCKVKLGLPAQDVSRGLWIGEKAVISPSAQLNAPLYIGDKSVIDEKSIIAEFNSIGKNVKIGKNVHLEKSIIMDNTAIGDNVVICSSIIGPNCIIEDDSKILSMSVLGAGSIVKRGSILGNSFCK